jgi:glutamate/tyrosine decarboxylase-like PLP-dependent enzyme
MSNERGVTLDISAADFRVLGHELVDRIADHLASLPGGRVTPAEPATAVRAALNAGRDLPDEGSDPGELLARAGDLLFGHSLFNGHPRFLGYITSSAAPLGMLGELLASAVNANCGSFTLSPMATEIEAQTVRWIGELVGFGKDAGGLLVSGGNMANFVCLLAARAARAGWDVRTAGIRPDAKRLVMYASAETHTWIQKAADLFGFGTDAIRWIPADEHQRMRVSDLARRIQIDREAGDLPFFVVGTAGSVSTGAVDPLEEISAICKQQDLWFHVDGAYGALAAMVPGAPEGLGALRLADSVAVDPHKWLYAPLEAGCVLVRDVRHLRDAFSYHPAYYHFQHDVMNFVDYGPQNSRGFRALKVWLALQQVGRLGALQMIADDMALARDLHELAARHPRLEALTQSLSITTFRYVPADLRERRDAPDVEDYLNRLNTDVLTRIEQSGEAFLSNAVVDGRYALRACIVNFRTSRRDLELVVDLAVKLGDAADKAGR